MSKSLSAILLFVFNLLFSHFAESRRLSGFPRKYLKSLGVPFWPENINTVNSIGYNLSRLQDRQTPRGLCLTIVYANNPFGKGLDPRWGFSCFIEGTEQSILFDVGGELMDALPTKTMNKN